MHCQRNTIVATMIALPIASAGRFRLCGSLGMVIERFCSWPQKSEIERSEHQNNADIHREPWPKQVSEERNIYTDDDGYHRHHVKHVSYPTAHFNLMAFRALSTAQLPAKASDERHKNQQE